jgi:divalent metal cation (Fe/Co/Zn/Cd) transporter
MQYHPYTPNTSPGEYGAVPLIVAGVMLTTAVVGGGLTYAASKKGVEAQEIASGSATEQAKAALAATILVAEAEVKVAKQTAKQNIRMQKKRHKTLLTVGAGGAFMLVGYWLFFRG